MNAVDARHRVHDRLGVALADQRVERRQRPGADAGVLQVIESRTSRAGLGQGVGLRVSELDRRCGEDEPAEDCGRGDRREPAMADDEARPGRPAAAGVVFPTSVAAIQSRSDRGQDDRQQRDGDGDADEGDEHPGDADAAQERHRQDDERKQRDRDRRAAEDDGPAGVLHGLHHGVVALGAALALLSPAHDDQQGVIDGDGQADQGDEHLDDDRDGRRDGERPDHKERRGNRDERHEQRDDRHPGREDEREDEQRAAAGDQSLDGHAGAAVLGAVSRAGAQGIEAGHLDRSAADGDPVERRLGLPGFALPGIDAALGRDVDQREGRPAVVGHERPVVRRGVRGDPRVGKRRLDLRHGRRQIRLHAGRVDRLALGKRDDRDERSNVSPVAVDGSDLAVGGERLARHVELLLERLVGRTHSRHARHGEDRPEPDDELLVQQDPPRERGHRVALGHPALPFVRPVMLTL
jgi:hypothetical protein